MSKYTEETEFGESWPMPLDYTHSIAKALFEYRGGTVTPIDGDAINRRRAEQSKGNHPSNRGK